MKLTIEKLLCKSVLFLDNKNIIVSRVSNSTRWHINQASMLFNSLLIRAIYGHSNYMHNQVPRKFGDHLSFCATLNIYINSTLEINIMKVSQMITYVDFLVDIQSISLG